VFLRKDLNRVEVRGKAGALELAGLFDGIAFGDEDEAMTSRQLGESFGDVGKQFDLVVCDGVCESENALALIVCDGRVGKLLEAFDERAPEAAKAVSVSRDGGVFATIQVLSHLFRRVDLMVEVGDERGDRPLEVDVVLPESVVGVDEQCVTGRAAGEWR
jgi:hypothetical protein